MVFFYLILTILNFEQIVSDFQQQTECPLINENDIFDFFERNGTRSSWVRPVRNFSNPIGINFRLSVWGIIQLDEKHQELFVRGGIFITWFDEFRVWNETFPLNCTDTVTLPFGETTKIWTPNIFFINS